MSKNEKNVKAVKTDVVSIVAKAVSNKDVYTSCYNLMSEIIERYNKLIAISEEDTNTLPSSTTARLIHLRGKAFGSRKQQYETAFESITKRQEKAKKSLISEAKKATKAKAKKDDYLKSLSPEEKADFIKQLQAVKI
jgi:hypothetical protein